MARISIFLAIFFWIAGSLFAQRGRAGGFGNSGETAGEFSDDAFENDTLDVQYYYQNTPEILRYYDDTLIRHFHEFDLSEIQKSTYLNLGYPGSPARRLIPVPHQYTGFNLGLNGYNPYLIDDHNFRFYKMKKALTDVFYTKGQTQEDGLFRARFSRNFKDNVQVSIDYNRYNNSGLYLRQLGRNTNLGVGLGYQSKNKRLLIFGTHYSNIFEQQNNGGITTDTLFAAEYGSERTDIPIYLNAAKTRDQYKSLQLNTFYKLAGKDSTSSATGLVAQYSVRSDHRKYRFSDTDLDEESAIYYGELLTDLRGTRHYIANRRIINDFSLKVGNAQSKQITVGLRNIINKIIQEPFTDKITEWKAYGTAQWNLGSTLAVGALGELNVNRENASFLLSGRINTNLGKAGTLIGQIDLNQRPPSLIQDRVYISQILGWEHSHKNIFVNHLRGTYSISAAKLSVTVGQVLMDNPIYFDSNSIPNQIENVVSLQYLKVYKRFDLGILSAESKLVFQTTGNQNVFQVPGWYLEQSLSFSGLLFKKVLDFQSGFDLRLNDSYDGSTYFPMIGNFGVEDRIEIPLYPALDFRVSGRVRYFRVFAKLHNILQPISDTIYYQNSRYPQQDLFFRLGVGWIFIN